MSVTGPPKKRTSRTTGKSAALSDSPSYAPGTRYGATFCDGFQEALTPDGVKALIAGATQMGIELSIEGNGNNAGGELTGKLTYAEIPGLMSAISASLARRKRDATVAVIFEEQGYHMLPNGSMSTGIVLAYATAHLKDIMDGRKLGLYAASVFRPTDASVSPALQTRVKGICAHHQVPFSVHSEGIVSVVCDWATAQVIAHALGKAFREIGDGSAVAVTGLAPDGSCPENAVYVVMPNGDVAEHELLTLWLNHVPGHFATEAAEWKAPF
jgi:hypothetical protein